MAKKTTPPPAVSIIIPLYNAEKYVGELLESIHAQTFQDFEVIVVDDCSTDNSCKIIENFSNKFNQLKLIMSKKNSGNPATPTNVGIKNSRGKYIFLLDNDDAILNNALEILYNTAENFNADVVHCEKYLQVDTEENLLGRNDYKIAAYNTKNFVTKPTLISQNLLERLADLQGEKFMWNLWTKFIRRDFIFENNLQLLSVTGQDLIFTCCLVCTAKNYVRVPDIVNIYRRVKDSLSHKQEDFAKIFRKWTEALFIGLEYLDKFLNKKKFFQENPQAKFMVFETVTNNFVKFYLSHFYRQIPAAQLDSIVRDELKKIQNKTALTAFFFAKMNLFYVELKK